MFSTRLSWRLPTGSTQYQLQVIPLESDGPGIDVIRNAESDYWGMGYFEIPPPPIWYGLLPDMTYSWRVRATDQPLAVEESDPSWSPWSDTSTFRTPRSHGAGAVPLAPVDATQGLSAAGVTVQWGNLTHPLYYYDVEVSADPTFNTDPAVSFAPVWRNFIHGGMSSPPNSWTTPALQDDTTYHWRVRARVQGDAEPVPWGATVAFTVGRPTPNPNFRLAFYSLRDRRAGSQFPNIYLINGDGTGLRRLTDAPIEKWLPVWSPDGTRLAFIGNENGEPGIYTVDADGGGLLRIRSSKSPENPRWFGLSWSPDGRYLGFLLGLEECFHAGYLYLMKPDGSEVRKVTDLPVYASSYRWAPDSSRISFLSVAVNSYHDCLGYPFPPAKFSNHILDLRSGVAPRLPDGVAAETWSPDSAWVAFGGVEGLKVFNTETGEIRGLTASGGAPVWSPDGSHIAFLAGTEGNDDPRLPGEQTKHGLWVVGSDGGDARPLTSSLYDDRNAQWSPDGQWVAFERSVNDIYAVNIRGKGLIKLTDHPDPDYGMAWAPR